MVLDLPRNVVFLTGAWNLISEGGSNGLKTPFTGKALILSLTELGIGPNKRGEESWEFLIGSISCKLESLGRELNKTISLMKSLASA